MVKLRTADRQRALGRIETAQCAIEAITTGVTADEDQIVRLCWFGDTAVLVTRRAQSECAPDSRTAACGSSPRAD